jgi:hypothetical protein
MEPENNKPVNAGVEGETASVEMEVGVSEGG